MTPKDDTRFAQCLASFLAALTQDEIEAVVAGRAKFQIAPPGPKRKTNRGGPAIPTDAQLRVILEYLNGAPDRESGIAKLNSDVKSKPALEALARIVDLPIMSGDTVDDLRQKIVEATIGYRLRSQAVKGREPG